MEESERRRIRLPSVLQGQALGQTGDLGVPARLLSSSQPAANPTAEDKPLTLSQARHQWREMGRLGPLVLRREMDREERARHRFLLLSALKEYSDQQLDPTSQSPQDSPNQAPNPSTPPP